MVEVQFFILLLTLTSTFDLDIRKIELQGKVLHLQMNTGARSNSNGVFSLPDNVPLQLKDAALADCQCSCAKALLAPLARHLLNGEITLPLQMNSPLN